MNYKRILLFLFFFPTLFSWVATFSGAGIISYEVMAVGNPIITVISIIKDTINNNFNTRYFLQIYSLVLCFISYKYLTFYNLNELKKTITLFYIHNKKIMKIIFILISTRLVYDFVVSTEFTSFNRSDENFIEKTVQYYNNVMIYCILFFIFYFLFFIFYYKNNFFNKIKYLLVSISLFPITTLSLEKKVNLGTFDAYQGISSFYELLKPLMFTLPDLLYNILKMPDTHSTEGRKFLIFYTLFQFYIVMCLFLKLIKNKNLFSYTKNY